MRRVLVVVLLLTGVLAIRAQEDPEYRMEIGGGIGVVNYLGDYNGNLLKNQQPMGSLVAKYRSNPRMSWVFNVGYGKLKARQTTAGLEVSLPEPCNKIAPVLRINK